LEHLNEFFVELLSRFPFPIKGHTEILEFLRWKERKYCIASKGKWLLI
jgi:hypothetical protein